MQNGLTTTKFITMLCCLDVEWIIENIISKKNDWRNAFCCIFPAFTYNPSQSPAASSTAIHYVTLPRQHQETYSTHPQQHQQQQQHQQYQQQQQELQQHQYQQPHLSYTTTPTSSSQHSSAASIVPSPSTTSSTSSNPGGSNKFTKSVSGVQIVNHADAVPFSEKPSAFKISTPVAVNPAPNPYYGLGPVYAMAPKYYAYQTGDTIVQPTSDYIQYGSHLYHPTNTHPQAIRVIQTVPASPPPPSAITSTAAAAPTSSSSVATTSHLPERTVVKYP